MWMSPHLSHQAFSSLHRTPTQSCPVLTHDFRTGQALAAAKHTFFNFGSLDELHTFQHLGALRLHSYPKEVPVGASGSPRQEETESFAAL